MVREARFSWDDIERLDPALRNERPDDFDGPDDDWVEDLKQTARRTARRRTVRKRRRPPSGDLDQPADQSAARPPTDPDPRRHLSGADWLDSPARRAPCRDAPRTRAAGDASDPPRPPFPLDSPEHTDDAA